MALSGRIRTINCIKGYTFSVILTDETIGEKTRRRGDPAGTGEYICESLPEEENPDLSGFGDEHCLKLNIKVEKKAEEVTDPRDGIIIECQKFGCPFNKGKER